MIGCVHNIAMLAFPQEIISHYTTGWIRFGRDLVAIWSRFGNYYFQHLLSNREFKCLNVAHHCYKNINIDCN